MLRPSIATAVVLATVAFAAPVHAAAAAQEATPADPEASPDAPPVDPDSPSPDPDPTAPLPPTPPPGVLPAPGAPSDPTTNEADKRVGVGLDAVVVIPIGDLSSSTGPLAGPLLRFGYRILPPLELSVSAGYLFAASKDQGNGVVSKLDILPVWLAVRWLVVRPFSGPYVAASSGVNLYVPTVTPPIPGPAGDLFTQTRRRFGAAFGAGYIISDHLPIDVRAQITLFNLVGQDARLNETEDIGLALSVGYTLQF